MSASVGMSPGGNAITVIGAGKNGIDGRAFARERVCQGCFHLGEFAPAVVAATNASLIGCLHNGNATSICQSYESGGARDQFQNGGRGEVAGVLNDNTIAVQK